MPFMDGFEATRHIIAYLKNLSIRLPHIIAVTGYSDQAHKDLCIQAGMEQVLHKPVDASILKNMMENYNLPSID